MLTDTNFLNNPNQPKIPYLSSIKILTNNFKLQKIKDIIDFWKEKNYEDEDLKIVYPTTPSSFNSFVDSMDIDLTWCTQGTSQWYSYT